MRDLKDIIVDAMAEAANAAEAKAERRIEAAKLEEFKAAMAQADRAKLAEVRAARDKARAKHQKKKKK